MKSANYKGAEGAVLTIGNFDGVHLGHKKLIDTLVKQAGRLGRPSVLYTFSPHPARVLFPEKPHQLLCSPEKKKELLLSAGVNRLIVKPFTKAFSRLSPEIFMDRCILTPFRPVLIVVGYNFRFGAGSAGALPLLKTLQKTRDFQLRALPPVKKKGLIVSNFLP